MIPNLFSKQKIPDKIPKEMQKIVRNLKKCKTKKECLQMAYDAVLKNHKGSKYGVEKYFPVLFVRNINLLWRIRKMHCTSLSFLIRVLLIKSKHFKEKDIKLKTIFPSGTLCPHSFIRVNTGGRWVDADPWATSAINMPLGEFYGHEKYKTLIEK